MDPMRAKFYNKGKAVYRNEGGYTDESKPDGSFPNQEPHPLYGQSEGPTEKPTKKTIDDWRAEAQADPISYIKGLKAEGISFDDAVLTMIRLLLPEGATDSTGFEVEKMVAEVYGVEPQGPFGSGGISQEAMMRDKFNKGGLSRKVGKLHGEGYKAPGQAFAIAKSMGYYDGGTVGNTSQGGDIQTYNPTDAFGEYGSAGVEDLSLIHI